MPEDNRLWMHLLGGSSSLAEAILMQVLQERGGAAGYEDVRKLWETRLGIPSTPGSAEVFAALVQTLSTRRAIHPTRSGPLQAARLRVVRTDGAPDSLAIPPEHPSA